MDSQYFDDSFEDEGLNNQYPYSNQLFFKKNKDKFEASKEGTQIQKKQQNIYPFPPIKFEQFQKNKSKLLTQNFLTLKNQIFSNTNIKNTKAKPLAPLAQLSLSSVRTTSEIFPNNKENLTRTKQIQNLKVKQKNIGRILESKNIKQCVIKQRPRSFEEIISEISAISTMNLDKQNIANDLSPCSGSAFWDSQRKACAKIKQKQISS